MTWQLNLFACVCDLASDYFQDRDVAIEKISDVRVSAVGRKDDPFCESPEFNVAYFCNLLAVDLKYRCAAILAREKCIFIGVPGYQNRESQVALWADSEAFRRVANCDVIDDTRRGCVEINHAHRIDVAIRAPPAPLFATSAMWPPGTMSTLYGKMPVGISYFS